MSTANPTRNPIRDKVKESSSTPVATQQELQPIDDIVNYVQVYARENPKVVAITCFAVGFVIGWKLKPW